MSTAAIVTRPHRPDIDGLRAVAVLAVIGFHFFPSMAPGGFVGVDIFFVISGYLISSIVLGGLEQRTFSFAGFYSRRIKRIFPALLLVLTACLIVGWFTLLPDEYEQLAKHTAAGSAFILNFTLWRESGYFDTAAELKPLLHLWSLSIEEQFYILWPFLLALLWKRPGRLLQHLCLLAVCSFALSVWLTRNNATAAFYLPFSRFWELLAGSGLGWLTFREISATPLSRLRSSSRAVFALVGMLLIGAAVLLLNAKKAFPSWWALLPVIGAA